MPSRSRSPQSACNSASRASGQALIAEKKRSARSRLNSHAAGSLIFGITMCWGWTALIYLFLAYCIKSKSMPRACLLLPQQNHRINLQRSRPMDITHQSGDGNDAEYQHYIRKRITGAYFKQQLLQKICRQQCSNQPCSNARTYKLQSLPADKPADIGARCA